MIELPRKYVDLTNLTMDGQRLPIEYVRSEIIWRNEEPAFQPIIQELEAAPQPGFFLTSKQNERTVRVRWHLNRHCVLKSDVFYGSEGALYRDIDAKGVGYTRNFPMIFLSVREPEMKNDMEMRGILHNEVATEDCLITEEISKLGIRAARYIAQIELFELVKGDGQVVPRQAIGKELWLNFDSVRPTIAVRAMGTTSRVYDLGIHQETNNGAYVKEIVDDAIGLVSLELGQKLTPKDYVAWFTETMGKQLGKLHKSKIWTDFMVQIHQGTHNLTLDCRLTDTYHYQTPLSAKRRYEYLVRRAAEDPKWNLFLESDFPSNLTKEEVKAAIANNKKGEEEDKRSHLFTARDFVDGVNEIYPVGKPEEFKDMFNRAYLSER